MDVMFFSVYVESGS